MLRRCDDWMIFGPDISTLLMDAGSSTAHVVDQQNISSGGAQTGSWDNMGTSLTLPENRIPFQDAWFGSGEPGNSFTTARNDLGMTGSPSGGASYPTHLMADPGLPHADLSDDHMRKLAASVFRGSDYPCLICGSNITGKRSDNFKRHQRSIKCQLALNELTADMRCSTYQRACEGGWLG